MFLDRWLIRAVFAVCVAALCAGCATPPPPPVYQPPPLKVGVARDYPPFVFRTSQGYSGAEAEMAVLLGRYLGRPVVFVERNFDDQIPSLLARETDIIMSGMAVTAERKVRIDFADYYVKAGLGVAMRADKAEEFSSFQSIMNNAAAVGVIGSTVAEGFVRRTFPPAIRVLLLGKPSDAPFELKNRRIDVYVDDTPSIAWLVSSNASEVKGASLPGNVTYYGWGIRQDNQELISQANAALARWKQDGTLERVLQRWFPYLKSYD